MCYCYNSVSEKKASKLERHFFSKHKIYDEKYPFGSNVWREKFEKLQKTLNQQQLVSKVQTKKAESVTSVLSIILWEIAKHMKPFTNGEFIKNCMVKIAAQLFQDKPDIQQIFMDIQLSARTVA